MGAAGAVVLTGGGALAVALRGTGGTGAQPGAPAAPVIAPQVPIIVERALSVRSTNPFPFSTTQVNGLPAIIVSGDYRLMHLHDLTTDRAIDMPEIHSLDVEDVEVVDIDGSPVVLAAARIDGGGSDDGGEISAFALQTPARSLVGAHGAYVDGLTAATAGGRPIAATIGGELMRRWDLRAGTPLGPPVPAPGLVGRASMSTFVVEGRTHLVADGGFVMYVWDLETGEQVATPPTAGGITVLDGAPVVVSARRGIVATDLHSGAELRRHAAPPAKLSVVAVFDGRPVVVTDGEQNTIVIRDVDTGQQLGAPLTGHQAELSRLGVADLRGRPVLVSAAEDNAIRVWDLAVRAAG
jgi:WD40 repeat protein